MSNDLELVNNPNTDIYVLTDIANRSPQLWPKIAVHPNCSPELAEWIKQMLALQNYTPVVTQATPVEPMTVEPTPANIPPVDATQVYSAPIEPTPTEPAPMDTTQVYSAPIEPTPFNSTPTNPTPATSDNKKIIIIGISFLVLIILASIITIGWILLIGKPNLIHSEGATSTKSTKTVESTEGDAQSSPSDKTKSPEAVEQKAITPHSHPLAGGPRPPQAKAPTSVLQSKYGNSQTAIIVTPSGNIGCDIEHDPEATFGSVNFLSCSVRSWDQHAPIPPQDYDPEHGGFPYIYMDSEHEKPKYGGEKHDGFCFMENYCKPGSKPQVLNYGEMIFFADFVCASEQSGLSCWSVKSGHGALMSRDHFETY